MEVCNSERELYRSINLQRVQYFSWITRKNDPNSTVQNLKPGQDKTRQLSQRTSLISLLNFETIGFYLLRLNIQCGRETKWQKKYSDRWFNIVRKKYLNILNLAFLPNKRILFDSSSLISAFLDLSSCLTL